MTSLQEMHEKTTASKEFDRMMRSVTPLCNFFGVNHFYYCKIFFGINGYITLGSHIPWHEYVLNDKRLVSSSAILKAPQQSITPLREGFDPVADEVLEVARDKFNIHFALNLQRVVPGGVECCGFGLKSKNVQAEIALLNHLSLLYGFLDYFIDENKKLISLAQDFQINVNSLVERSSPINSGSAGDLNADKSALLYKQLGLDELKLLSTKEITLLKYLAQGFSSNYIAEEVRLSKRTIENYIASIKLKLDCKSKTSLIKKSQKLSMHYPSW